MEGAGGPWLNGPPDGEGFGSMLARRIVTMAPPTRAKGTIKDVAIGDKKLQAEGRINKARGAAHETVATLRMPFEKRQRQQTKTEPTMLVNLQTLAAAVAGFYWLPE
jgi:uncharacterized protein YjbJ (UPF0337 family)